jgi:hypothetical protein
MAASDLKGKIMTIGRARRIAHAATLAVPRLVPWLAAAIFHWHKAIWPRPCRLPVAPPL